MTLLSDQFAEVVASLRPDAETLRLQRRAPVQRRDLPAHVPTYRMSCALCGSERESYSAQLCKRCEPNARKL